MKPRPTSLSAAANQRVLRVERLRNARRAATMRVAIIGVFLANILLLTVLEMWPFRTGTMVFTIYFVLAGVLWLVTHRSERAALLSWLTIPALDLPIVFAMQVVMLPQRPPHQALSSVLWLLCIFLLLILFSALSLSGRIVIASAAVALGLELVYGNLAAAPTSVWFPEIAILVAAFTATTLYAMRRLRALIESTAEEQVRVGRLRRYFSPQVAAVLEREGADDAEGATRRISVLFGDIRGFTRMTRDMPSEGVVDLLNEYHSAMVERIFNFQGTLDKFIGDGIMAYFNAPLDQPDHATRATLCAADMMQALAELNGMRSARGESLLRMGIGIHTGPATVGSIGSSARREYTAVGETVNLAAHLERLARGNGGGILLTEATRSELEPGVSVEPEPDLALGDGDRPIPVYRYVALADRR